MGLDSDLGLDSDFAEWVGRVVSEISTALQVIGVVPSETDNPLGELSAVFPALLRPHPGCPVPARTHRAGAPVQRCQAQEGQMLGTVIIHLNDYHRWDRECVASWLESLDADLTVGPARMGD